MQILTNYELTYLSNSVRLMLSNDIRHISVFKIGVLKEAYDG